MKTALFLMVPHLSHYYPTFGLACLLQKQGYTVVYSGTDAYQIVVEREGFLFRPVSYAGEVVIRKLRVALGLWIKTRLDPAWTLSRYRHYRRDMQTVERLFADIQPEVVFLDDTLGHYYACLRGEATVVQLSTKLSPRRQNGIPPLDSFYIPKGRFVDSLIAGMQWWWHIRRRRLNEWVQLVVFNGYSDGTFQRRYERQKGVVWSAIRDENVAFYDVVAGLPALVLAPRSLDFEETEATSNEQYLYIPYMRSEQAQFSPRYAQWMERIVYRKRMHKSRFVYVALGTLSLEHSQQAHRLLTNIMEAFKGDDTIDVLVATGALNFPCSVQAENICCLPVVPQLDVLLYADLMITHGGLGSLKECVAAGVPMLVYPLNTAVDQPGNSARIVRKGLGLRGRVNDTPIAIRRKVEHLLSLPLYRRNCEEMQQNFIQAQQTTNEVLKESGLYPVDLSSSDHIN